MVAETAKFLAASLRSGSHGTNAGGALLAEVTRAQQFYNLVGIPEVCTTSST